MGLDASVRFRCFEDGKLKPGPVPYEDLYIDEDGYLSSKKLDEASWSYGFRRYHARYELLEREFEKWSDDCCEHEFGDYCLEQVSNWAGCAQFRELIEEAGGKEEFPLLSNLLPHGNGGIYPADQAQSTLEELDRFIQTVAEISQWVLCDRETGTTIWTSTESGTFTWMFGPLDSAGMDGGKVFFTHDGNPYVETSHFKQIPLGKPDTEGYQKMRIICLETGAETETFDSLGPEGAPKIEREFYVTSMKAPFIYEGKYGTAERIRQLLVASIETGNPIRWC